MVAARVHIVGAGLAGLSAAVRLVGQGHRVVLYEAAPQAGGRCRSYFDSELGCRIDNGNHLLLSANTTALDYLSSIGATGTMIGPSEPRYDFCDVSNGERWTLAPGLGRLPWWIFDRKRRVPGSRVTDYLKIAALRKAGPDDTIADCLDPKNVLFELLWRPFAVAVLNTEVETGSASLLWQALAESFGAGGKALLPMVPREGLSESFVDPALSLLALQNSEIRFGARLRGIALGDGGASALEFDDGPVTLGERDAVILAVPAPVATRLLPGDRRSDRVPRHRQCPLPARYRRGAAAGHRCHRRHGGVDLPQTRHRLGDGERRRPAGRHAGRNACANHLEGCRQGLWA